MTGNTRYKWYDSNALVAIATVIIAFLSIALGYATGRVQFIHLLIATLTIISLIAVWACIRNANKFERMYEEFVSILATREEQEKLKQRIEEMKQKLANVEWLKRKEEFQKFEESDETDEVWVLTFDFRYEIYDFKDIVIANLKKGKRYVYIYPRDARNRLFHFKGILDEAGIPDADVNKQIIFYELDKRIVPLNEAIYNPTGKKKMRAITMTPEVQFEYYIELNPEQTSRMIEKFRNLMNDAKKMNLSAILAGEA